jgi:hypothetical protein
MSTKDYWAMGASLIVSVRFAQRLQGLAGVHRMMQQDDRFAAVQGRVMYM